MTHLLDSSAALAMLQSERGGKRVAALLDDPRNVVGISVLTFFEVETAAAHRTGSLEVADEMVNALRREVARIVPVTEEIVDLARGLRREATGRIATVDVLIAASAVGENAILVHRDPHFDLLPADRPRRETIASKA